MTLRKRNLGLQIFATERKTCNPSQLLTFEKKKKVSNNVILTSRARSLSLQKPHLKHSFTQRQRNQHVATRVCYYHAETLVWRRRERSASGTFIVTDIFVSSLFPFPFCEMTSHNYYFEKNLAGCCWFWMLTSLSFLLFKRTGVHFEHEPNALKIILHVRCEILGRNAVRKRGENNWHFVRSRPRCDRTRVLSPRQITTTRTTENNTAEWRYIRPKNPTRVTNQSDG